MKSFLKKIIGYLGFCVLIIVCLTLYIAYIKHEPALTILKEDTEESKAIDKAIALDSGVTE